MVGVSMSLKVCSAKRTPRAGAPARRSGSDVAATTGGPKAGGTAQDVTLFYITRSPAVYPRMWPRNAPSRSKIEALQDRPGHAPTAPGVQAKGDNCATPHIGASIPEAVVTAEGDTPSLKHGSAAIAGHDWTGFTPCRRRTPREGYAGRGLWRKVR